MPTKIKTLEQWDKKHIPKKGYLVASPHVSVFQVMSTKGKRKITSSSVSRRGAICDQSYASSLGPDGQAEKPKPFPHVFEVASNPLNKEDIRRSILGVLTEKVRNDLRTANGLLRQLGLEELAESDIGHRLAPRAGQGALDPLKRNLETGRTEVWKDGQKIGEQG